MKTMDFQAEVKQLLKLVVNSLYTQKEIFMRELIANASDALDRLRILALTEPDILGQDTDLSIRIEIDREARTLTISDNGIGMTYDDVMENLGTIAKSGSLAFVESLREGGSDETLIGQFGVGFYSAFMVADQLSVSTKHPHAELGVCWESEGEGTFEISEIPMCDRGTRIVLRLRENTEDESFDTFLDQFVIQKHVQHYSNFVQYPIRMDFETQKPASEGSHHDEAEFSVIEQKTLNSIKPLWEEDSSGLTDEDYASFYRDSFNDYYEPAETIHFKGEGTVVVSGLLFIPSHAPYDLYTSATESGVRLFSNRVLVMESCQGFPEYLSFMQGVIDSPDLPLNISRETLQHGRQLKRIVGYAERKILSAFRSILKNDRGLYEALWAEFGKSIKGGIFSDPDNVEKLQDLLVFGVLSAGTESTTLSEYVARMPEDQEEILFATGPSREAIEKSPQLEGVREKGYEVLLFVDKVDEFLTQSLTEYQGKPLKSISRVNSIDLSKDDQDESPDEPDTEEGLLEYMKTCLGEKMDDVRASTRLTQSPVCLASAEIGHSLNMERLMREANQSVFRARKILEINLEHAVVQAVQALFDRAPDDPRVANCCRLLYEQAVQVEGERVEDPWAFAESVSSLIVDACKGSADDD